MFMHVFTTWVDLFLPSFSSEHKTSFNSWALGRYKHFLWLILGRRNVSGWPLMEVLMAYSYRVTAVNTQFLVVAENTLVLIVQKCSVRIKQCLWIYVYPVLHGKRIWLVFRRPRFKSWLDLNAIIQLCKSFNTKCICSPAYKYANCTSETFCMVYKWKTYHSKLYTCFCIPLPKKNDWLF